MKFSFFRFSFFVLSLLMLTALSMSAQTSGAIKTKPGDDPEIGIVEHLGEIIPGNISITGTDNKVYNLKQLLDKPTILNLVYFRCPGICSPIMNSLSDVIQKMDMTIGKEYQVITLSFDPREGPELAARKKKNYMSRMEKPIDTNGWRFYTSDSINIARITQAVGFKFKMSGNDYLHAGALFILSPEGKITRYHYGTLFLPFDIKLSLIEAAQGKSMPTINRVLEFCFNYDPAGHRYVLDVTKIAGTLILFIAILIFAILMIKPKRKTLPNPKEE